MIGWLLDYVPVWVWWLVPIGVLAVTIPYWLPVWMALPRPVKGAILAVAGAFTLFAAGRRSGKKNAEEERARANANAIKNRSQVDDEVRNLPPAKRDERLDGWMRDR